MVPSRWDMHSGHAPDDGEEAIEGSIKKEVREKAKVWHAIAQREENEQRARHLRLVLPPCPCKSTSGGHGAAAKVFLLALFRSHMLPISAVSANAEELRANRVGPMTRNDQFVPVSNFESKQTRAVLTALLESGEWGDRLIAGWYFSTSLPKKSGGNESLFNQHRGREGLSEFTGAWLQSNELFIASGTASVSQPAIHDTYAPYLGKSHQAGRRNRPF